MHILILNWRDPKNPNSGGAEILTHEIAKRIVARGHGVTQFSSMFPNAKKEEYIDGVKYLRKGKWWTVHFYAIFYYLKNKHKVDVVIDEVHWFPFFSVIYARNKTVALTCEVASKLFYNIFPTPIAYIFLVIEKIYLNLYKNVPTMAISNSTYKSLLEKGHKKENIIILPMGITKPQDIKTTIKEKNPVFISVGRLNLQKGTLDVVKAFAIIHKEITDSILWLVGSGNESFIKKVRKLILENNLQNAVKFHGFVSENEKFILLSKAHVLISASRQEGWGLTIPEAGLMKTPSVVYNIEGFRDNIEQNKTGILVENNPESLALEAVKLFNNKIKYKNMQEEAYKKSKTYSWDNTADQVMEFLNTNLQHE